MGGFLLLLGTPSGWSGLRCVVVGGVGCSLCFSASPRSISSVHLSSGLQTLLRAGTWFFEEESEWGQTFPRSVSGTCCCSDKTLLVHFLSAAEGLL